MIEILPIQSLTNEDYPIFGSLSVALGKLARASLPVAKGIVITPPNLKLKTTMEHFDFKSKEVFEQSLTLVKKEIFTVPVPEILLTETNKQKHFFLGGTIVKSQKELWRQLLNIWINTIKKRLWKEGFYKGITEGLDPQIVIFIKKVESFGTAFFDNLQDDSVINVRFGKTHPSDLKKIDEMVKEANKKLFIPHEYEWIVDRGVKLTGIKPYTPNFVIASEAKQSGNMEKIASPHSSSVGPLSSPRNDRGSAVKVFLDLSSGLVIEKEVEGIYIAAEKIFDLNKPRESFENMVFKLVESAATFSVSPVLFKLADKSEGMGKVRGALRLLHQQSLLDPMVEALDFVRHKKGLNNIHPVIPFVRGVSEFLQIKRELAIKKLMRKQSLQLWLEAAVPENIVNLEDYLIAGLDGVVLNLDELISHLNGFDSTVGEVGFYKNEAKGLLNFLEDGLKLLHKGKIPFLAYGSLSLYPAVLEFLVEKGVLGIVVERYEASSAHDLLHQVERRMILRSS